MPLTAEQAKALAPLTLAWVGDAVLEVWVRTRLAARKPESSRNLHKMAISYVCATAEAALAASLQPVFTPTEQEIFRRGRNAHPSTVPKNASVSDYRAATGLEAVLGYLHLTDNQERLHALLLQICP